MSGSTGLFRFQIGIAVALLQQDLAILHHQHRRPGNIAPLQLQREDAVEESFQIGLLQRMRRSGAVGIAVPGSVEWAPAGTLAWVPDARQRTGKEDLRESGNEASIVRGNKTTL